MKEIKVVLVGQPNVGKTMLINSISNAKLKVGNFSGVTVEKSEIFTNYKGYKLHIIDLPGSYSLTEYTTEEKVTKEFLYNGDYDIILNVINSSQLEKNLYLSTELLELNRKTVIALNMIDESEKEGIEIDSQQLSKLLGSPVHKVSAVKKSGLDNLLNSIVQLYEENSNLEKNKIIYNSTIEFEISEISIFLKERGINGTEIKGEFYSNRDIVLGLLRDNREIYNKFHDTIIWVELQNILRTCLEHFYIHFQQKDLSEIFLEERISISRGIAKEVITQKTLSKKRNITENIDVILLHQFFGIPIFLLFMWGLFQLTFELGSLPMNWIDSMFSLFGNIVGRGIENELLHSLIVDGVIAGVGAVVLFLPNILILFLGIALLETTGYMSRVAFLLDGFFHKFGLHGQSFIPLVTGFGCSIPAYMAARTLKNEKDRLITLFIISFMSCGAKLSVYVLFVSAFFPTKDAGNILFAIYLFGAIIGLISAKFLKKTIFKGDDEPFVMELPKYRLPSLILIWHTISSQAIMYLKKAGTFILFASVLIWFLSTFPKIELSNDIPLNEQKLIKMENSYLGLIGKFSEPIFKPLGFDWKMTVALETGLTAKEVIVATLGVLYSLGDEVNEQDNYLLQQLRDNIPIASAFAFIVFVIIYLPCLAAISVFTRESGKVKYLIYLIIFTTTLAYILSFLTYRIALIYYPI